MLISIFSAFQQQLRLFSNQHGKVFAVLLLLFITPSKAAGQNNALPDRVYFPGTQRQEYYIDLLQLALSYPCGPDFELQASNLDLPKARAFDLMNAHQGIDVMYGSASRDRMELSRAVPFPIMRGLMGLRVALVSKEGKHKLQHIYSLSALAKLRVGQFTTWSDTAVLRANDFNLEAGSDLDGLYQMLARGRIDYFPRSVLEVQQNQQQYAQLNLEIDPHIVLYYPTAVYFYVAKDNKKLADALLCGLEKAQQDGQLNTLFHQYYGGLLQQLQIDKRRVFTLKNPLLPDNVPLQRPELWYPLPLSK